MRKERKQFLRSFIVMCIVIAMTLTSIPCSWATVSAATTSEKQSVSFKSANYRRMHVGDTYDFDLVNKQAGAKYTWTSSKSNVATVNSKGVVKAKAVGTTTIICKVKKGNNTTTLKAVVYVTKKSKDPAVDVKINNKITSMAPGETYDLNRTYMPTKAEDSINWTSSNTNVISVDKNGVITAKTNGSAVIKATAINGKVSDKVSITVSNNVKVSSQKELNRALKAENASTITIKTNKEIELSIPEGDYSSKKVIVNAPKATIENKAVFKSIEIRAIKPNTWKEFAKGNVITILAKASIIIENGAKADIIINRSNIDVSFKINGIANIVVNRRCDVSVDGTATVAPQIKFKAEASIRTKIPVQIEASKKFSIELQTVAAASTTIKVENEKLLPTVIGNISAKVTVGEKEVVVTEKDSKPVESGSSEDGTQGDVTIPSGPSQPSQPSQPSEPERVKVDENGLDANRRVVAYFGAPDEIDGVIDDVWKLAEPVKYVNYSHQKETDTAATLKVLWDDKAIYFLAEVKDSNMSLAPANVYEKDSVEFFLDQDNKRDGTYAGDDSQFRINYANEQSCDHGDLLNCYTAAKEVEGGYIIEGRVSLQVPVANDTVMGIESQINDAEGSSRVGTISIFDTTGTAYQDTSKFGEVILVGKKANDVTRANNYDLRKVVAGAQAIDLKRYANADVVTALVEKANNAIANKEATQEEIDQLVIELSKAIDNLKHNDEIFDEKECLEVPKAYKASDPEEQRGSLEMVTYQAPSENDKNELIDKNMVVYLPKGYNDPDNTKKYNVLYLVHGMAENEFTPLGYPYPGSNGELMRIVDNLIADGKMEPMIIVSPTWYLEDNSNDGNHLNMLVRTFEDELENIIIPTIEGKYRTYAKSTSKEDLVASRAHRAFGGFSMGGNCTWYTYINSFDYFKYYIPVSMWSWIDNTYIAEQGFKIDENDSADVTKCKFLASIPEKYGYTANDFYLFGATGTADLASPIMPNQFDTMKALSAEGADPKYKDIFRFSADMRRGNTYFILYPGGAHNWTCVDLYLYNILPDLFKTEWTNDYGLTQDGAATAKYGSPLIDGKVDAIWSEAKAIVPKYSTTPEDTSVTFKTMWDDNALYVLAEVKDTNISKDASAAYEQDSIEIFLDEKNDGVKEYAVDDLHFRVNYDNNKTADNGDASRMYSKTTVVDGGYIVEARISWQDIKPANDTKLGIELQVNDAKGASRVGTINVFDKTGNGWQDVSVFGKVVLLGRPDDAAPSIDPYDLLIAIEEAEAMDMSEYKQDEAYTEFMNAISKAKEVVLNASSQEEVNNALQVLNNKKSGLNYTEEAAKVKRYTPIPVEYLETTVSGGAIVKKTYKVDKIANDTDIEKTMYVYLPAGYNENDTSKKYNVLYLMHGGGESEELFFGENGGNKQLKTILDNMIEKGALEPMIVVAPTFYYTVTGEDGKPEQKNDIANFYKELEENIIPLVDGEYNTYTTREHRAFGGFSMGSVTTWYTFANALDSFKYFIPLSGDCWALSGSASSDKSAETAAWLAERVTRQGMTAGDFKLLCATGDQDIAYPNMAPQMAEMEKLSDMFIFDQDLSKGNTYFMVAPAGTHAWGFVNQYLYHILPDLFQEQ